jgi:hypothetical protein
MKTPMTRKDRDLRRKGMTFKGHMRDDEPLSFRRVA